MGKGGVMKWWRRLVAMGAALILGGGAAAQSNAVPASWQSYAGLVVHQFQAWLMADDEAAYRLHRFLEDRTLSAADEPAGPLLIRVWIDPEGQVSRLDFPSLGQAQADSDLRRILTVSPLSEPPPPDMRQPLTLRLNLQFKA